MHEVPRNMRLMFIVFAIRSQEVQARQSTLLFQHAAECASHGPLLPMDGQLHWVCELQVLPAVLAARPFLEMHFSLKLTI